MRAHSTPAVLLAVGLTLGACSSSAGTGADRPATPSPNAASRTPPTTDPSPEAITTTEMSHKELAAWAEEADGPSVIAAIGNGRFWPGHEVCEPLHVYAQTFGGEGDGRIIGVGIHYRCYPGSPGPWSLEGLAMLELGARLPDGFEPDPDGLIVREEVLADAEDLTGINS